jgi:hypothetical protein
MADDGRRPPSGLAPAPKGGQARFWSYVFGQPKAFSIEYDGAKNVVPVIGVEKSSIRSCRPAVMPLNMFASIFSITHRFLV